MAGGLSLLFPTCYRKPLPNTIEEAENKRLPPHSLKHRYPSFRDLKNGKISSIAVTVNGINGNVYTIPPNNYDKTQVKIADQSDINQNAINHCSSNIYEHNRLANYAIHRHESNGSIGMRPATVYNDDADSRLSDLEEELNDRNNWRLYSHDYSTCPNNQLPLRQIDSHDVNRSLRDMHVFTRPVGSTLQHNNSNGQNIYNKRTQTRHHVAETNL